VQSTLDYLQQSSVKLNDDLEAVQHSFLLKGFFKKREKAKQDSIKKGDVKMFCFVGYNHCEARSDRLIEPVAFFAFNDAL
jgi:hypothetical protein